jgi:hypothetical protein
MPLPSMHLYGAKQCTANSKRTKQRCKNPAAYGCRTCKVHGSRKNILSGKAHPNWKHGRRTIRAQKLQSESSRKLQMLEDAMHLLGMTKAKRLRGRRAIGYKKITSIENIKEILK